MLNGCTNKTVKAINTLFIVTFIFYNLLSLAHAAPGIGVVIATIGSVKANGRSLARRSAIYQGDNITTAANSKVSFKLTDGSVITLKENSSYTLSKYSFNKSNAPDNFKANLIKGGLKTVTGAIGKEAQHTKDAKEAGIPENKQVKVSHYATKAAVATIGVRGTEYECLIDQDKAKLYISAIDGTVEASFANNVELLGAGADASYIEIYFDGNYNLLVNDPIPYSDFDMSEADDDEEEDEQAPAVLAQLEQETDDDADDADEPTPSSSSTSEPTPNASADDPNNVINASNDLTSAGADTDSDDGDVDDDHSSETVNVPEPA